MKKGKPIDSQKLSAFQENILQFQNQMLSTYVSQLKRELDESRKLLELTQTNFQNYEATIQNINRHLQQETTLEEIQNLVQTALQNQQQDEIVKNNELELIKKENICLQRRLRILSAYNSSSIERNIQRLQSIQQSIENADYECICGAKEISNIKEITIIQNFEGGYNQFVRSAFPISDEIIPIQTQPIEVTQNNVIQTEEEQQDQSDSMKMVIEKVSEEKAQLLKTIEELRISNKIPEIDFFSTQIYESLTQQNKNLVEMIQASEKIIRQQQQQIEESIRANQVLQEKLFQVEKEKPSKSAEMIKNVNNQPQQQLVDALYNSQNKLLQERVSILERCEQDLKNELEQIRKNLKAQIAELTQESQKRTELLQIINNLKQEISALKGQDSNLPLDQMNFRYDKHKALLLEIENEYAKPKGQEYLNKYRELVGYIKMRDEKVRGLENQIEQKQSDIGQMKKVRKKKFYYHLQKRIESLFEELDFNAQENASQMEKNRVLSKLLDETQKNEARAVQERYLERNRLENEKNNLQQKISEIEDYLKIQSTIIDQMKMQAKLFEEERVNSRELIDFAHCQLSQFKVDLVSCINELEEKEQELSILKDKAQLGELVNQKYIKAAEKSKVKQKALKSQLKLQIKNRQIDDNETELVDTLKAMVNCQQCKKKLKEQIIIKCLHMFCKGCIEENQRNRNRACSICRTKYSLEEVKLIKFT